MSLLTKHLEAPLNRPSDKGDEASTDESLKRQVESADPRRASAASTQCNRPGTQTLKQSQYSQYCGGEKAR